MIADFDAAAHHPPLFGKVPQYFRHLYASSVLDLAGQLQSAPTGTTSFDKAPQKPHPESMSETVVTKDLLDAKIETVRAQNDARFAEVLAEVRAMNVKLDHVPTTRAMVGSIIGGIVAAVTIGIGAMALFGASFNSGFSLSNIRAAEERVDREQNERINAILTRMDAFIASQGPGSAPTAPQQ